VIPGWKVRRELSRLGQQLRAVPEAIWEPVARRRHDAALLQGFPLTQGSVPLGSKVAIILCWQPNGIVPSFLETLDHLIRNGYAPFVVANAAILASDRPDIISRSWRTMERPNFGYDFGGYRDGLVMLRRWGVTPERLVIMNDSVWFPVWASDDTLQQAERTASDVAGMILRNRNDSDFLESYFFSIKGTVLDHAGFRAFWDGLRLTSNKYKVIRRGERGFGAALTKSGLTMGALFPRARFLDAIAALNSASLRQVLRYAASPDPDTIAGAMALANAPDSPVWQDAARSYVERVLLKGQVYSTLPVLAAKLNYPVLKKSREPVSACWRNAFLRAVQDGVLPPPLPTVLVEARQAT